ncbi:hypothetical protein ACS0TY_000295 [Phlomoides rotata]
MGMKKWISNAKVPLSMLMVQLIAIGLQILAKVILSNGTFVFALMTYRNIVAALSVSPFALYIERGAVRKLTFAVFFWLFMAALTGITVTLGLFYYGLKDTSATYATNFLNLIPVVTFLLSTILRTERLELNTRAGKIKTLGTMLCLAGALTMALYKGKSFNLDLHHHQPKIIDNSKQNNKTRGTLFLVASCFSYSFWCILQVKLSKIFPYKYSTTLFTCVIASVQATVIGLCIDRKPRSWRLGWDLQLVTILYSGLATAASFSLISVAIAEKGPTYPSMFNPLSLICVAIIEALFLGEEISVGSLIGMALIVVGLYSFLWGKHKSVKATPKEGGGGGDARPAAPESAALKSSSTVVPIEFDSD